MTAAYSIKVQNFEGPLDLLTHLIEKDKIDIYDIPIVSITEQYIAYINAMQEYDIEVAVEFLYMAAHLLQIKSKMLLPKTPLENEDEGDPRQMLVEMLVEYRRFKQRAELLRRKLAVSSAYVQRLPMDIGTSRKKIKSMSVEKLVKAMLDLLNEEELVTRVIERQEFHVRDKMTEIMELLSKNNNALAFSRILNFNNNRSEQIAAFLAVLELLRLKKINIRQKEAFAPIYLFMREEGENHV